MAIKSHWRGLAAPIIARVLAENAGKPERDVRRALRKAYPFGRRSHHPYKIWLDEIQVQTGRRQVRDRHFEVQSPSPEPDPRQGLLFA